MIKKDWIVALITVGCVLLVFFSLVEIMPAGTLTEGRLHRTKFRIREYYSKNKTLPLSLKELTTPKDDKHDNSIIDAWGREIIYRREGYKVELISYGKSGKPGSADSIKCEFDAARSMQEELGPNPETLNEPGAK
jgi:hypothetical protein